MSNADIKIKSIQMTNWKCFKFKTFNFNDEMNTFQQENGFGKSSMFQAIIYCLYGKFPIGISDVKELKNDETKDIKLSLTLKDNISGQKIEIQRNILSGSKKVNYILFDGNKKSLSQGQMNDYLSGFCGSVNIFPLIWSDMPLNKNKIFDFNFIKNEVLKDEFSESELVLNNIKSEKFKINKDIKIKESILEKNGFTELKQIQDKLDELRKNETSLIKELKNQDKNDVQNDNIISKARICIENKKKFEDLKTELKNEIYSKDDISEYEGLLIKESRSKKIISEFSPNRGELIKRFEIFNLRKIRQIIEKNQEDKTCPCCNRKYNIIKGLNNEKINTTEELINELNGNVLSEDEFENAKKMLERLSEFDESKINNSKKYYRLEKDSNEIDNPEEIIKAYSEEIKNKWSDLENIQKKIKEVENSLNELNDLINLKDKISNLITLEKVVNRHAKEKTDHFLASILFESSKILTEIDPKYMGVYYDIEHSTYKVCMNKSGNIKILSYEVISSGEKSVLALSLIIAFRNVIGKTKGIPNFILFDESLSALDKEHLNTCFELLKNSNIQPFIVNHN